MSTAWRHGNPTVMLPAHRGTGRLLLTMRQASEPCWRSHEQAGVIDALTIDVWHGAFLAEACDWAVLPAGRYRLQWCEHNGAPRDLPDLEVENRTLFDDSFPAAASLGESWLTTGSWRGGAIGLRSTSPTAFLFREAAMHGRLTAHFHHAPPNTPEISEIPEILDGSYATWGLIARHYHATMHMLLEVQRDQANLLLRLLRIFDQGDQPTLRTILGQATVVSPPAEYRLGWELNGSCHVIHFDDQPLIRACDPFMGGVDVVGVFSSAQGPAVAGASMFTTQGVCTASVEHPRYRAIIRPGNIRSLTFPHSQEPRTNIFWESGLQFGHIGGSELKFTQGARQQVVHRGSVATTVTWQGPMPKFVEQSHDVRGHAWGGAQFYPDRIVIADQVLAQVRRSVGPDVDLLDRHMAGPARIAMGDSDEFTTWHLPPLGRLDPGVICRFPMAAAFALKIGTQRWWLNVLVLARRPTPSDAPAIVSGWRCPRGLTASHHFRVAPTTPGQLYAFTIVMHWLQEANEREALDALRRVRSDWLCPMRIEADGAIPVVYDPSIEQPGEALHFIDCFDQSSGRYVLRATGDAARIHFESQGLVREGVVLELRGWRAGSNVRCRLNDRVLAVGRDVMLQDHGGNLWVWLGLSMTGSCTLDLRA